jgi:hypothetical protein
MDRTPITRPTRVEIASWIVAGIALFLVLQLHLLPALLAGLLVFELVHIMAPRLRIWRRSPGVSVRHLIAQVERCSTTCYVTCRAVAASSASATAHSNSGNAVSTRRSARSD